jgi:ABC-type transport system involved in multi-copper enzyme maturation permease subunit
MNDPRSRATWQMLMIFSPGVLVLLVAIPPLLAEVIPLDHQYKVASLLNTTPLSRARYLIGKLLSVWLGLVIGLSIAAIVYGFYMMTVHGAIDVWTYVRYWVVMALLPALLLAGFAVVVPALVRSRRAGVLIGIGMIPLALYLAAMTLGSGYVLPILFRAAALAQQGIESAFDTAFNDTLLNTISTQIPFALVLFGVGMGVWAILRAKEATS